MPKFLMVESIGATAIFAVRENCCCSNSADHYNVKFLILNFELGLELERLRALELQCQYVIFFGVRIQTGASVRMRNVSKDRRFEVGLSRIPLNKSCVQLSVSDRFEFFNNTRAN